MVKTLLLSVDRISFKELYVYCDSSYNPDTYPKYIGESDKCLSLFELSTGEIIAVAYDTLKVHKN